MAASYTFGNSRPRSELMIASGLREHAKAQSEASGWSSALDDDEQEEVCAALQAGFSVSELARVYDVSSMTIMGVDSRF
jgi:hypothetical protein